MIGMFFFGQKRSPLGLYYGFGNVDQLSQFEKVVLQPGAHSSEELAQLAKKNVQTLAYLSLSQDSGPTADWHLDSVDPEWGSHYVKVDHPLWPMHLLQQAEKALELGFFGLFLDTLDVNYGTPEYITPVLSIARRIRLESEAKYVLANRGFGLLPALGLWVDGILFESFSVRWGKPSSAKVSEVEHRQNIDLVEKSRQYGLDLYSLDYADTPELKAYAKERAESNGLIPSFGNRTLDQVIV